MSAAQYASLVLRTPSRRALPTRVRPAGRLETLAIAAVICLPVPLLAATGLSVPLPNVVERIAAALVPWADPVALDAAELDGTSGSIVPTAAEAVATGVSPQVVGTVAAPESSGQAPAARGTKPVALTPGSRPVATGGGTTGAPSPSAPSAPPASPG
jgi:hypothetical protein